MTSDKVITATFTFDDGSELSAEYGSAAFHELLARKYPEWQAKLLPGALPAEPLFALKLPMPEVMLDDFSAVLDKGLRPQWGTFPARVKWRLLKEY